MPFTLVLALLAAEPAPQLVSYEGLNVKALRPWLEGNLPSLTRCGKLGGAKLSDEVVVKARFSSAPDVVVEKVDGPLSDPKCVKEVVEGWKNDGHQPRAGPFRFVYRLRKT
ncbi:MAG: hypothetical protein ACOZQL_33165 [Myxococcota bacterium]